MGKKEQVKLTWPDPVLRLFLLSLLEEKSVEGIEENRLSTDRYMSRNSRSGHGLGEAKGFILCPPPFFPHTCAQMDGQTKNNSAFQFMLKHTNKKGILCLQEQVHSIVYLHARFEETSSEL